MNPIFIRIYHRLPIPMRSIAATMRGYYLRSWRYGSETDRLVEEALEKENWSTDRWKQWQEDRLSYVLHRAATQVPYYKNFWSQQRQNGNYASWDVLDNWPILKKEVMRENPLSFVAEDCNIHRMFCDNTSGTTGTPLSVFSKRRTLREYFALYEARLRRWHGVSWRERWSILGGQQVVPFHKKTPPFWVINSGLNQLYLSTYHISAKNAKWYVDALNRYMPTHMVVYPSSAFALAESFSTEKLIPPPMKVIFSNAELLLDNHKEAISKVFRCPVINTYGMGEMVAAASECKEGTMHIWPEVGKIEVYDDMQDLPSENGKEGRLILTSLLNEDMPLIRYDVGDRGSLACIDFKCECGKTLPVLSAIKGRLNDLVLTPDGRRVFWLNPVFYNLPVKEAQIIQEELERIRVRYVPTPDFTSETGRVIIKRLYERTGIEHVVLESMDQVPRGANGKFRSVISLVRPSSQ